MKQFIEVYVPITDHEANCDFSSFSASQVRFKERI